MHKRVRQGYADYFKKWRLSVPPNASSPDPSMAMVAGSGTGGVGAGTSPLYGVPAVLEPVLPTIVLTTGFVPILSVKTAALVVPLVHMLPSVVPVVLTVVNVPFKLGVCCPALPMVTYDSVPCSVSAPPFIENRKLIVLPVMDTG